MKEGKRRVEEKTAEHGKKEGQEETEQRAGNRFKDKFNERKSWRKGEKDDQGRKEGSDGEGAKIQFKLEPRTTSGLENLSNKFSST